MITADQEKRTRVAVLFGGRSVEHEISVITALELIEALDVTRYDPVPVYIDIHGRWFSGRALLQREFYRRLPGALKEVREVTLPPHPGGPGLLPKRRDGGYASPREAIPVDVFVPAFHGQFGEDGCMQGLLELADVAYTGCDVLASAVAMNKYLCKSVLSAHGIPVLPSIVLQKEELRAGIAALRARVLATPGLEHYPLFVKPCNLGSSIGVGVARDDASLDAAIAKVFKYDLEVIIEPCVSQLMEINVSVREDDPPIASVVEIPVSQSGVLTYEDKYLRGGGGKKGKGGGARGMASLVRVVNPTDLDPKLRADAIEYALRSFAILGCGGISRFDFIVNLETGQLYFNELNPFPGSLAYYLWAKSDPARLYTENLTHMIERARTRKLRSVGLTRDMGFKALFR